MPGTWKPTGKKVLGWSLLLMPEYSVVEVCVCCGARRVGHYISLADKGEHTCITQE